MTGQEIYEILVARGVHHLHHANSVRTSLSQLSLGGLASRQFVEQKGLAQTKQFTDDVDREYGIWGDIFVDTVDIHARASDRNKYGPVLFVLDIEILRSLPTGSRVLVTRLNPSKWQHIGADAERYFLNSVELEAGLSVGDFDQMLVIRTLSGFVPFQNFLQTIILDKPRLAASIDPEYDIALDALTNAVASQHLNIEIIRRQCGVCRCVTSYANPVTRIPWFYRP